MKRILAAMAALALTGLAASTAASEDLGAGRTYAQRVCAQCHDVQSRDSGLTENLFPPAFHTIANARRTTAMGLNVFLVTPHANMPNLIIPDADRRNLIAYILSFKREKPPST